MLKAKLHDQVNQMKQEAENGLPNRIKIKRKHKSQDFSEQIVREVFSKFGKINFVIMHKSNKYAILEFDQSRAIKDIQKGCPSGYSFEVLSLGASTSSDQAPKEEPPVEEATPSVPVHTEEDYEDFVLKRMQEAQNAKRKDPLL